MSDWYRELEAPLELLAVLMEDEDPRVRLQALAAAKRFGTAEAGDIAQLARHFPMDASLRLAYEHVTETLGTWQGSPPGLRAQALARSNAELLAGEVTPPVASVLFARDGVEIGGLVRAASVLARRQNQDLATFLMACLKDPSSSDQELRNVLALLAKAEGWTYHYASPQLQALAKAQPRILTRHGAYAALLIGAAASDTLDRVIAEVASESETEVLALLQAAEYALEDPIAKARLQPWIIEELARTDGAEPVRARFVQVISPQSSEMRFVEFEVFVGTENVALGKAASQLQHPDSPDWWGKSAGAGVNGISHYHQETELTSGEESSIRGVIVGGPRSAEVDLWWGVDLGKGPGEPIDRLVLHPSPGGFQSPWVRFDLRDFRGERVWTTQQPVSGPEPVEVRVDLSGARIQTAKGLAATLGESFVETLLAKARRAGSLKDRFRAMRALQTLGRAPADMRLALTTIQANRGTDALQPAQVVVRPRQPVEVVFENLRRGSLRLVVLGREPESREVVASADLESEPEIPSGPVLFRSESVSFGQKTRLRFLAPEKPGRYPLRCQQGDFWMIPKGVLVVR